MPSLIQLAIVHVVAFQCNIFRDEIVGFVVFRLTMTCIQSLSSLLLLISVRGSFAAMCGFCINQK